MKATMKAGVRSLEAAFVLTILGIAAVHPAAGQELKIGAAEYTQYCAGCHGADGRGGGPIAEYFGAEPPSLTLLAKNNGGKFPLQRAYQVIDGRVPIKAHGEGDMQIWGNRYRAEIDDIDMDAPEAVRESLRRRLVRGRILELIFHLQTIQED